MSNLDPSNVFRRTSSDGSTEFWLLDESRKLSSAEVQLYLTLHPAPVSTMRSAGGVIQSATPTWSTTYQYTPIVPGNFISGASGKGLRRQGPQGFNADKELVVGEIVGARVWSVDRLGRLIGVTYGEVLKPGDNPGTCGAKREGEPGHSLANCSCGYHAYFAGQQLEFGGEVGGIIAGSGETVVGTKGFRSKRARLVALVVEGSTEEFNVPEPTPESEPEPELLHQRPSFKSLVAKVLPRGNALHYMAKGPTGALLRIGTVVSSAVFSTSAIAGLPWAIAISALGLVYGLTGIITDNAEWRRPRAFPVPKSKTDVAPAADLSATARALKLSQLYPGIPIYASIDKMLQNHKLSNADDFRAPDPSPQNTDNFWDLP
jgi:hypothetical protein